MAEVIPGIAVFAVVLANRTPLPLAQIRSPFLPRDLRLARIVQPLLFRHIHECRHAFLHGSLGIWSHTAHGLPVLPSGWPTVRRRRIYSSHSIGRMDRNST